MGSDPTGFFPGIKQLGFFGISWITAEPRLDPAPRGMGFLGI